MSDVIVNRETFDAGQQTYFTCADDRGLGIDDCGCGQKGTRSVYSVRNGLLRVSFSHHGSRCFTIFRNEGDSWLPMTYEEYTAMLESESEE